MICLNKHHRTSQCETLTMWMPFCMLCRLTWRQNQLTSSQQKPEPWRWTPARVLRILCNSVLVDVKSPRAEIKRVIFDFVVEFEHAILKFEYIYIIDIGTLQHLKLWNYAQTFMRLDKIYLHSTSSSFTFSVSGHVLTRVPQWDVRKIPVLLSFPDRLPPFDSTWLSDYWTEKENNQVWLPVASKLWSCASKYIRTLVARWASEISFQ